MLLFGLNVYIHILVRDYDELRVMGLASCVERVLILSGSNRSESHWVAWSFGQNDGHQR